MMGWADLNENIERHYLRGEIVNDRDNSKYQFQVLLGLELIKKYKELNQTKASSVETCSQKKL